MHTATWLGLHDELEKIAQESVGKGALQGAAAGTAIGGTAGLIHGAIKGHQLRTIPWGAEKLVLNPKERRVAAAVGGAMGGTSGALKGLKYGLIAGGGLALAAKAKRKLTKKKEASDALEVAGLGALALPTIQKMRGKAMSEKNTHRAELGGLGILAAHPAYELGKKGLSKLKGLAGKMPKHAGMASPMSAMMKMHGMADAAKAATRNVGGTAKAVGSLTNNAKRAPMLQSFQASGGHAFKRDPSRALSL